MTAPVFSVTEDQVAADVAFSRAPATTRLRAAIEDDIRGKATPQQVLELTRRENLVTWIRVLNTIEHEVEGHIAKSRMGIANLKPINGAQASPAYLAAKRRVEERTAGRLHFLDKVRGKRTEVASLISAAGLTTQTLGTVVDSLVRLEGLLDDDDIDSAHDLVSKLIDRYEREGA